MNREFKIALGMLVALLGIAALLLEVLAKIHFWTPEFLKGFLPFLFLLSPYILFSAQFCIETYRSRAQSPAAKFSLPAYVLLIYSVFSLWGGAFSPGLFGKLALWLFIPTALFSVNLLKGHPLYVKEFIAACMLWLPIEFGQLSGFDIIFRGDIQIPALAFAAPILGLYLFAVLRDLPDIGYHFRWRLGDLKPGLISLLALACLLIPLGTRLGFISFSSFDTEPAKLVELIFGIYFLVALPEELLFRGIFQNLFKKILAKYTSSTLPSLLSAAVLFGLSHYNNFNPPDWRYVFLATIAGVFYGWTYNKTGKTTVSALVHTGVNVLWAALFKDTGG